MIWFTLLHLEYSFLLLLTTPRRYCYCYYSLSYSLLNIIFFGLYRASDDVVGCAWKILHSHIFFCWFSLGIEFIAIAFSLFSQRGWKKREAGLSSLLSCRQVHHQSTHHAIPFAFLFFLTQLSHFRFKCSYVYALYGLIKDELLMDESGLDVIIDTIREGSWRKLALVMGIWAGCHV